MQHQLQGTRETVLAAHSGQDACLNVSGFSSVFLKDLILNLLFQEGFSV